MCTDAPVYDVSVIVPMYKVADYLTICIDSLLSQTLGERLQIILVDDGSPDESGVIGDRYALENDNVTCVHRSNGGLGPARNSGIEAATGKYIGFVDGDDWVDTGMYEALYMKATETCADAVYSGMRTITHGNVVDEFPEPYGERIFEGTCAVGGFRATFYGARPTRLPMEPMQVSVCPAIYRNSLIKENNIRFEHIRSEDIVFNLDYLSYATVVACIPRIFYNYRKDNQVSITSTFNPKTIDEYFELFDKTFQRLNVDRSLYNPIIIDDFDIRFRRRIIDCTRGILVRVFSKNIDQCQSWELASKVLHSSYFMYAADGYPWWKLSAKQALFFMAMKLKFVSVIRLMVRLEENSRSI